MRNYFDSLALSQCSGQHSRNVEHQLIKTSMPYGYIKHEVEKKIQRL